MQIRKNIAAIRTENVAINTIENAGVGQAEISGLRSGKEIFLPPRTVVDLLSTYCHEVGHIIGDDMSFQDGSNDGEEPDVLSIDEVKDPNTRITLTNKEQEYLKNTIFSTEKVSLDPVLIGITNKLLDLFTKGNFDPRSIRCHSVTQKELEEKVSTMSISTLSRNSEGGIIAVNSKDGRDSEIPSFTTELSCLQILENTLAYYEIFSKSQYFIANTVDSPAHQRAKNILSRAFEGRGWRLPSMKDIRRKKS